MQTVSVSSVQQNIQNVHRKWIDMTSDRKTQICQHERNSPDVCIVSIAGQIFFIRKHIEKDSDMPPQESTALKVNLLKVSRPTNFVLIL